MPNDGQRPFGTKSREVPLRLMSQWQKLGKVPRVSLSSRSAEAGAGVVLSTAEAEGQATPMNQKCDSLVGF